ncbi:MAG: DEAD/DEAH box helicase [Leptospirales bacterium]
MRTDAGKADNAKKVPENSRDSPLRDGELLSLLAGASPALTPCPPALAKQIDGTLDSLPEDLSFMMRILAFSGGIYDLHNFSRLLLRHQGKEDTFDTVSDLAQRLSSEIGPLIERGWLSFRKKESGTLYLNKEENPHLGPAVNRNTQRKGLASSPISSALRLPYPSLRADYPRELLDTYHDSRDLKNFNAFLYAGKPELLWIASNACRGRRAENLIRLWMQEEILCSFDADWLQAQERPIRIALLGFFSYMFAMQALPLDPLLPFLKRLVSGDEPKSEPVWENRLALLLEELRFFCPTLDLPLYPWGSADDPQIVALHESFKGSRDFLAGKHKEAGTAFVASAKRRSRPFNLRFSVLAPPFYSISFLSAMLDPRLTKPETLLEAIARDQDRDPGLRESQDLSILESLWKLRFAPQDNTEIPPLRDRIALYRQGMGVFSLALTVISCLAEGKKEAILASLPEEIDRVVEWLRTSGWTLWASLWEEVGRLARPAPAEPAGSTGTGLALLEPLRPLPYYRQMIDILSREVAAEPAPPSNILSFEIHWKISENILGHYRIDPMERKRLKSGQWGKIQSLSYRKIGEPELFPEIDERNRLALKMYLSSVQSHSFVHFHPREALAPLLNILGSGESPCRLFWNDSEEATLLLESARPTIHAVRKGTFVKLSMEPPPVGGKIPLYAEWDPPRRIRVIESTPDERKLVSLFSREISVPVRETEALGKILGILSKIFVVESEIGIEGAQKEEVPPDSRTRLLVTPVSGGFSVQFCVRPLGEGTSAHPPGKGLVTIFGSAGEHQIFTRRSLSNERESLKRLLASCPALEGVSPDLPEWQTDSPQDFLSLLNEVRERTDGTVVEWAEGRPMRLVAPPERPFRMTTVSAPGGYWLEGTVELSPGEFLTMERLLKAWRNRLGRFVPLDERGFLVLSRSLEKVLAEIDAHVRTEDGRLYLDRLSAAILSSGPAGEDVEAGADLEELIGRMKSADETEVRIPPTLMASLRPYQEEGFRWMARLAAWGTGACLADDMGLGKTLQILTLILSRSERGPCLVVAPASVVGNWIAEIRRFAPTLGIRSLFAGDRERAVKEAGPNDIVIASYALLVGESDLLSEVEWNIAVLDEAQAIKNADTRRAQAAFRLSAGFRVAASGTPLENHLGELWSLFRFLAPGYMGTWEEFRARYASPIEQERDAAARIRLRRKIQPFFLRRLKSQVLEDLPPKIEIAKKIALSPEEIGLYEAIRREAVERMEAMQEANEPNATMVLLASLMRLRRAACHPDLVMPEKALPSSKLSAFTELVEELRENNHRALVFSQFVDHLALLRSSLEKSGVSFLYLDGSTPQKERTRLVERFQSGEGDLFLISLKAGGTGLNLTGADFVIHMDPWWNPAVEDQATDRAHRIGQERPVTVYRMVSEGTVEEKIMELHRKKRELAEMLLEGTDSAARLDIATMRELLSL